MNKLTHIIIIVLCCCCIKTSAQAGLYVNGSDACLRVDSNAFISVMGDFRNEKCDPVQQVRFSGGLFLTGSLINNDSLNFFPASVTSSKKAKVTFTTSASYAQMTTPEIAGNVKTGFWELEISRGMNGYLMLETDIVCLDTLTFTTGYLLMNNRKIFLTEATGAPSVLNHPFLKNERQGAQLMASSNIDTALVIYKSVFPASLNLNPGNIGLKILGQVDIGSPITITRGFRAQVNAGKTSLLKYFDVHSPGYPLITNTLLVNYSFNDMNYYSSGYFNEPSLKLFASPVMDMNWSQLNSSPANVYVLNSGPYNGNMMAKISDFRAHHVSLDSNHFRITIADPNCQNPPLSALLLDTLHICAGKSDTLDAGNNTNISNTSLRYTWEEQNGIVSHDRTLVVMPGSSYKKYKLLLSDVRGCMTSDSIVIAPQAPFPTISYLNHLNSCKNDSVTIKDTIKISSGLFSSHWNFSDSTTRTGNAQQFRKKFPSAGDYAALLTVTSDHGCVTVATITNIVVYPNPSVSFVSTHDCMTNLRHFTNTSVSNHTALAITQQKWDFGLGLGYTSTGSTPSQSYILSGSYPVRLVSTSSFGCKDSVTLPVVIHPRNGAAFTSNNACTNDTVNLQKTAACLTGSCVYEWEIGNQYAGSSTHLKQVFTTPGIYTVKLKVTNPIGCADSSQGVFVINPRPNTQFTAPTQSLCPNEILFLQNTSSISAGAITTNSWSFGNGNGSNNIHTTTSFSLAGYYLIALWSVSDSGCVSSIQTNVIVHPKPSSNYAVNNVCEGKNSIFASSSSGPNYSFVWDYGNSVNSGTVTQATVSYKYPFAGTYTTQLTTINQWGCSEIAAYATTIHANPVASLGSSISTCGTSYSLNANNPGSSYLWSPGNHTTAVLNIINSGIYQVQITATNACVTNETVSVKLNALVLPNLGKDTSVCGSIVLDAGYPGSLFQWNTGSAAQAIQVNSSGKYSVYIVDQNGCIGSDTINVLVKPKPTVHLGDDITQCNNQTGYTLVPTGNASSYVWHDGTQNSSIVLFGSGIITVTGMGANGCLNSDTMILKILITPNTDLGPDRSACGSATLSTKTTGLNYSWSTGDTTEQSVATTTGKYWMKTTDPANNCSSIDTINVTIFPLVVVKLPPDTSICTNNQISLNAGNPGASYNWSNGSKTQTTVVSAAGFYAVSVTSAGGCSNSDFIQVSQRKAPTVELGNYIQYICGVSPLIITSTATGAHTWSSAEGFISTAKTVNIATPGKYRLHVHENQCTAEDSITVVASSNTITAQFLASTQDTINKPVQFINLTEPKPISQTWHFGDGIFSHDEHPTHTYVVPQDYSVTLEVTNGYCTDRITKSLHALFRETKIPQATRAFDVINYKVYPNPAGTHCRLTFELTMSANVRINIIDLSGKALYFDESFCKEYSEELPAGALSPGLYFIRLIATGKQGSIVKYTKLIITQ